MQALELILILLALAAGLHLLALRISAPLPALLVVGGLVLAVIPGLPSVELDPDVVFLVFVPPLLYLAALTTSFRDFRRNLPPIARLGVGLVLATMGVVAWVAHAVIPEMTWGSAFVLGAIVSPPDAVAVTAVTRRLGVPRTVTTILDGESLINDATAFVAYRMAVAAVVAGTFSFWEAGIRFLWTGAGGIALGLAVGWLVTLIRRGVGREPVVENTISLLTPYAAFIAAERLGLASVLAVVAAGLYLSRKGPTIISAETRLQAQAMWEVLGFLLEGLIFIIIGLELPVVRRELGGYALASLLGYTVLLSAVLIFVRIAWMFPAAYLPRLAARRFFGGAEHLPPWRQVLFVGWAGMRGADSLVIALALPLVARDGTPFPGRSLIIVLTFAVILVTLVAQGLTLTPVIRLLGLRPDDKDDAEESMARLKSARAGLSRLNELSGGAGDSARVIDDLSERYEHRIHRLSGQSEDGHTERDRRDAEVYRRLRLDLIAAERSEVIRLRDREEISDEVLRRIQEDLDHEEMLLREDDDANEGDGQQSDAGS